MKFGYAILALALNPLAAFALPIPGPIAVAEANARSGGSHGSHASHPAVPHPYIPPTTGHSSTSNTGLLPWQKDAIIAAVSTTCAGIICWYGYPHAKKFAGKVKNAVTDKFGKAVGAVSNVAGGIQNAGYHVVEGVSNAGSYAVGGARNVGGGVAAVSTTAGNMFAGAKNGAIGAFNRAKVRADFHPYTTLEEGNDNLPTEAIQVKPYHLTPAPEAGHSASPGIPPYPNPFA